MFGVLFQNDIKYFKKDPTMWLLGSIPLIFVGVYYLVDLRLDFLVPFQPAIRYLFVIMTSCMGGVLWGLRMLDDKDEHMVDFYAVSPIGLRGYLQYRGGISLVYSLLATGIVVAAIGEGVLGKLWLLVATACLGPLVNFLIYTVASNKIQGMAIAKVVGIIVLLPLTGLIRENFFTPLIKLLPHYGIYEQVCMGRFTWGSILFYLLETMGILYLLWSYNIRKG